MIGLHVHPSLKELKKGLSGRVFLTFLGTSSQDGRSDVQGVSQGCQRGDPENTNVAPALPKVAHGALKVTASVF